MDKKEIAIHLAKLQKLDDEISKWMDILDGLEAKLADIVRQSIDYKMKVIQLEKQFFALEKLTSNAVPSEVEDFDVILPPPTQFK